ncbi:MAG: MBL fold metallo-hydrolase [Candidatus Hodarchaeales archaeon]|jgi:glyoxylase-like metal-dependent hydrolase (beta-lactamase superfamily II)
MTKIKLEKITINLVGSSDLSALEDCCVYLISGQNSSILVDTGAGSERSIAALCYNIETITPLIQIHHILVTHAHIDHVG